MPPTCSCATTTSAIWPTAATRRPASAPTRSTCCTSPAGWPGEDLGLDAVDTDALLRYLAACRAERRPGQHDNVISLASGRAAGFAPATINRRLAAVSGLFSFRSMRDPAVAEPGAPGPGRAACRRRASGPGCWLTWPGRSRGRSCGSASRGGCRAGWTAPRPPRLLSSFRTDRDRAIAGLMLLSGLRSAEVLGLRVADVDIGRGWVRVTGKGDKERRVPRRPGRGRADPVLPAGRAAGDLVAGRCSWWRRARTGDSR